jgi:hypothetical protein
VAKGVQPKKQQTAILKENIGNVYNSIQQLDDVSISIAAP